MKVTVAVKPGSKKGPLIETDENGGLVIYVRERAIDGAANEAVIKLLAEHFGIAKSNVTLISGGKSKAKLFHVDK